MAGSFHSVACKLMGTAAFCAGCWLRDDRLILVAIYLSVSADEWL